MGVGIDFLSVFICRALFSARPSQRVVPSDTAAPKWRCLSVLLGEPLSSEASVRPFAPKLRPADDRDAEKMSLINVCQRQERERDSAGRCAAHLGAAGSCARQATRSVLFSAQRLPAHERSEAICFFAEPNLAPLGAAERQRRLRAHSTGF